MTLLPLSPREPPLRLGPFRAEAGVTLPDLRIAYRRDGPPTSSAVLVVHALTGSADAAGDWWEPLIGPGKALDTDERQVICLNLLGSCYGTTGPREVESFPSITPRDMARAQWAALDALGVERLELVVGGSLGGMVALEVALERPEAVDAVMPIAAPAVIGNLAAGWNHIQLQLLDLDRDRGLELARQLAMTTYRSEVDFDTRDGIGSYLEHQGIKLRQRFDAGSYASLAGAMNAHDIGRERGGLVGAFRILADADVAVTGVGIEGDILYGPRQVHALVDAARSAGADASYREIRSDKGHDAFLVEWDQVTSFLREGLSRAEDRVAASA
ncbi:MAG TPA: alpha/beta fold hydrolase [Candidatus Limnocylindrales bacterium]|nr:alpha/beta fold hydrolase [Candidatus Limnocylindrales bacterium]